MTGRIQRNRRFRGTRFSVGKSSVLYLCGADGSRNCSTPRKVWLQLRRSGGKGCPLRGSISDRKRLAGGADMHCLSAVSSAKQRYIKAPSAAAYHHIRTTTAAFRAGCPSPCPPPSLSGSRSDGNGAPHTILLAVLFECRSVPGFWCEGRL